MTHICASRCSCTLLPCTLMGCRGTECRATRGALASEAPFVRRIPVDLAVAIVVVAAISVWESLQCWDAMIGCNQPWAVGWARYLALLGALLTGPFSGVVLPLLYSGATAKALRGITFTAPFIVVAMVPWIAWALTRSPVALAAGVLLWVSTGFLFCIAIWI